MTSCIIIENDDLAGESLRNLIDINFSDELYLEGSAHTIKEGVLLIKKINPQLVFLNIEFPGENGFSLFNYFSHPNFKVIFVTSSSDYAVLAIKHNAIDYLIKPVSLIDLGASLIRLTKRLDENKINNSAKIKMDLSKRGICFSEKIALPTFDGFQVIPFNEIVYCSASENYSNIYTFSDETILTTKTLKLLEELLPSTSFFRIHKSILLNINYVKHYSRKEGFIVTLENGHKFEIASRRQEEFLNIFLRRNNINKAEKDIDALQQNVNP